MGLDIDPALAPAEIGEKVAAAIYTLTKTIGLKSLKDYTIDESELPAVAEMALTDDTAQFGPKAAGKEELLKILHASYSN